MSVAVSPQWLAAVPAPHRVVLRVEMWNGATYLGEVPCLSGEVTDQWVTGSRRSLTIGLPPTAAVKALITPGAEVRPYCGISYGFGAPEYVAMGRYPITAHDYTTDAGTEISLSTTDRWQWIVNSPFLSPRAADVGLTITAQIVKLITETAMWTADQVTVTATSTAKVVAQTWDTDRHQAIADLAQSIGAEVFIDRNGNPVIQDRQARTGPARALVPGDGGVILSMTESESTADVYNVVRISSTNTDPALVIPDVIVRLTDSTHPAYPSPGRVTTRPYQLTSAQYSTTAQATAAAQKVLTRISGKARQIALSLAPDPAIDASDTISFRWPTGTVETAQVQTISHPLRAANPSQVTTVSTRTDEDFNP